VVSGKVTQEEVESNPIHTKSQANRTISTVNDDFMRSSVMMDMRLDADLAATMKQELQDSHDEDEEHS
jgi:hypothetical protein